MLQHDEDMMKDIMDDIDALLVFVRLRKYPNDDPEH